MSRQQNVDVDLDARPIDLKSIDWNQCRVEDGYPVIDQSIYDFPKYYDLVFGSDVAAESKFILGCADSYLNDEPGWYFEPACGTGRLLDALRRRGCDAFGLDLNPKAVLFCNQRLKRYDYAETAIVANMCDFDRNEFAKILKKDPRNSNLEAKHQTCGVAFNTINSFRHVGSEKQAQDHLSCMAKIVRRGGIYLLGVHLTPTSVEPSEGESWSARRGHLSINTHMWTVERNKRTRLERFGIRFDIHTPAHRFRINDELRLRSYTPSQMKRLIDHGGQWKIIGSYDFGYELDFPIEVNAGTEDVVYVLRRQ